MKTLRTLGLLLSVAILMPTLAMRTRADESNKLTYFTFSAPVEIPGGKVLPAGTYAFKVMDTGGDRNIVQIFNKDLTRLYATVVAIPDYRPNPTDKTIVKFSETPTGGPAAIKEWFYPGDTYGQEFVYPKNRAVELAKASKQPVPSMPQAMASNMNQQTAAVSNNQQPPNGASKNSQMANQSAQSNMQALKDAPLKAEEPNGEEVEIVDVFVTHPTTSNNTNTNSQKHH